MKNLSRRVFLRSSAIVTGVVAMRTTAQAAVPAGRDPFNYEITRTETEWRTLLGDDYGILREGLTEKQRSSPLWNEERAGSYTCKGCDLLQYTSRTKVVLSKGWAFFTAGEPNAQLMSQDSRAEMMDDDDAFDIFIEVHCRRCGSHLGHILPVEGKTLHCINGASLNFTPTQS